MKTPSLLAARTTSVRSRPDSAAAPAVRLLVPQTPTAPAYPVPRFEMLSCHDDTFADTPAHKRVGCYAMVYEDDEPDLNIGAPTGALIYHLLKACAPDGSDGETCCAEFANDATVHYHGPVQPGLEHYPTESIYDDDDAANDEDGDPPPPRNSFCYGAQEAAAQILAKRVIAGDDGRHSPDGESNICFAPPAAGRALAGWNGTFPTYAGTCCNHVPDDGTWTDNDATILLPHHALPTCSDGKVVGASSGEFQSICGGEAPARHVFGHALPSRRSRRRRRLRRRRRRRHHH